MAFADLLGEREYFSQYEIDTTGIVIHISGVPTDPDANDVDVGMKTLDDVVVFAPRPADNPAVGVYETELQSAETATQGIFKLTWTYAVATVPQTFISLIEVGVPSVLYDSLSEDMKGLIELTWTRFADLFDSPFGGPHLQVYFQANFNRGRMADLLRLAVGTLNTVAQPMTTYTISGTGEFPIDQWGALLEKQLYIETLKHLIRSYTEQPEAMNVSLSRLDRRDYVSRWRDVLLMEQDELKKQMEGFKIAHMGLGRPRVLVSGGVYGTYGPTRLSHSAAARPRYWFRFH